MSESRPPSGEDPTLTSDAAVATGEAPAREQEPIAPVPMSTYRFIAEHGRGGLGRVMRARDKRTNRLVAVKEMLVDSDAAAARFRREALITANLQHPGIVPVYEVGQWPSGKPFYAMKLVEGRSLREVIDEAPDLGARLGLLHHVTSVAEALAYAHSMGVIHRDLKPSNILVGSFGETVVIDWGLAKELGGDGEGAGDAADAGGGGETDSQLTRAGAVMGTPAYMAPEQARGEPADARTDVYALGCVLYHLLAGQTPYAPSESVVEDLLAGPPRPIGERVSQLPADLVAIVDRAMAREPGRRYASAAEVAEELRRFETGKLVAAHSYSASQLLWRWIRRHRAPVAVGLAAAIGLAALGVVSFRRIASERDVARSAEAASAEAREIARQRLADLHAELGRREVADGEPFRALVHLAEAGRIRGELSGALRYLAGRALESVGAMTRAASFESELVAANVSDGTRWASFATADRRVELWDLDRGALAWRAPAGGEVRSVSIAGDGRVFAATGGGLRIFGDGGAAIPAHTGSAAIDRAAVDTGRGRLYLARPDGAVELRSLETGALEATWPLLDRAIDGFGLLAGGSRLAAVADDGSRAVLVDAASGRLIRALDKTRYIERSPDGSRFAVTRGSTTEVVDAASGRTISTIATGVPHQILMASNDRVMTGGLRAEVSMWDVDSGERVRVLGEHSPGSPAYGTADPERGLLLTNYRPGVIRAWDLASGQVLGELRYPRSPAVAFALGTYLVVAERDGARYVWPGDRLRTRAALIGHTAPANRLRYAGDDQLITASEDGTARLWDARDGRLVRTLSGHRGPVLWAVRDPTGAAVATASADGVVRLFDAATGALSSELRGHTAAVRHVAFGPDFVASVGEDGTARIWSGGAERCRVALPAPGGRSVQIFAKGRRAVVHGEGPVALVVSTETCAVEARLETNQRVIIRARVSPDDRAVILAGKLVGFDVDGAAALFHLDRPGQRIDLEGLDGLVAAVAFSPDGSRLAVGDTDGALAEYAVAFGERLRRYEGIGTVIGDVTYAGPLLVAATDPGAVVVFDRATGELLERMDGMGLGIYEIEARPDGRQVATAALDDTPRLWSLPRFEGTADELQRIVECEVDWMLGPGGRLVLRGDTPTRAAPRPGCRPRRSR